MYLLGINDTAATLHGVTPTNFQICGIKTFCKKMGERMSEAEVDETEILKVGRHYDLAYHSLLFFFTPKQIITNIMRFLN